MSHLEFDRIFDLMGCSVTAEDTSHVSDCEVCRRRLDLWRTRLDDLREIGSNPVSEAEKHNLRALFRELGPSPAIRNLAARLIRTSEPVGAGAVRGGLAATFAAYEAGPYQIVLQLGASQTEGRFDIQGQVVGEGRRVPSSTQVVLTSEAGFADLAPVDTFGEFRLAGVPEGPWRLVWYGGGERIELEGLDVGECDDEDGG
jgi:hypothetical protein